MRRFLNNSDYLSILTEEALDQLIRGREERLEEAEEAAEATVRDYLTEHYEIDDVFEVGKNLVPYNSLITYPSGAHFIFDGKAVCATRSIGGRKAPSSSPYWEVYDSVTVEEMEKIPQYSQRFSYVPGNPVKFNGNYYRCLEYNGLDYGCVKVPGIEAWKRAATMPWKANVPVPLWTVVEYEGKFYTLTNYPHTHIDPNTQEEVMDWITDPATAFEKYEEDEQTWGLLAEYDPEYTDYDFSEREFVVYEGAVYFPVLNPNPETPRLNYNIRLHDPRNPNIKRHMLRLAIYELYKLITPNNVSAVRITDYEASLGWLRDAARFKINPNIERKSDKKGKPLTDYSVATFQAEYNPYLNPWQI